MAMVRLTFFVPSDVLERYDALVYRSGVKRSYLLREALEHGLAGVRAALPRLRARYADDRMVRRRRALGPVDDADRADAANLGIERRLVRVGRVMLKRVPGISPEELRTALHDACEPNDLRHKSDELLDRVVDRVLGNPSLSSASGPVADLDSN